MMETDKSLDFVLFKASAKQKAMLNETMKPVSTAPAHQIERNIGLDKVLEEMAEIIEAEGGILTP
jgi:hypothetical protein